MKYSPRKLLSLLMALAICLSLLPGTALAADGVEIYAEKSTLQAGESITLMITNSISTAEWEILSGGSEVRLTTDREYPQFATLTANSVTSDTTVIIKATATDNAGRTISGTVSITVLAGAASVSVKSVDLNETSISAVAGGDRQTVTATVIGSDNEPMSGQPVTVSRTSGDSASVSSTSLTTTDNGTVTFDVIPDSTKSGTTTFSVSAGGRSATLRVDVEPQAVEVTASISPAAPTVTVGQTVTLRASVSPSSVIYTDIVWSSMDEDGSVNISSQNNLSAVIEGVEAGSTTVIVTLYNNSQEVASADVIVTVTPAAGTPTLTLPGTLTIASGKTGTLSASLPAGTSNLSSYSISWGIEDPELVSFTNSNEGDSTTTDFTTSRTVSVGLSAGAAAGTTTVYATLFRGDELIDEAACTVTVSGGTVLTLTPASISVGYDQVTSSAVSPTFTSGSGASYIDWEVRNGSGSAWISTTSSTASQANWGSTAVTRITNGVIPGVYVYGRTTGTATLVASLKNSAGVELASKSAAITIGSSGFTLVGTPSTSATVNLNNAWNGSASGYYYDFSVDPRLNGSSIRTSAAYDIYYTWTLNGYTVQNSSSYYNSYIYRLFATNEYLNRYLSASSRYNVLTCTVDVYEHNAQVIAANRLYTKSVSWDIASGYNTQFTVSATIYDSNPGYALTDTPDGSTTSIADQIDTWVRNNYYYSTSSSYYRNYDVRVYGGTNYESGTSGNRGTLTTNTSWLSPTDLSKIIFTPGSTVSTAAGSYQIAFDFEVRVYNYNTTTAYDTVTGTMVFTVKQGAASAGNINYSAELGKDVHFSVSDFENFWSDIYSRGALSYVTFGSVSSGTVYNASGKSAGSTSYYVSPRSNQSGLDGVYFSPNSSTSRTATTVRIPFTAYGTTSSTGTAVTPRSGTIVITYLSAAASVINYPTSANGTVSLKAQDFIDAYKAAVKTSSNPSNLTIVFQSVPAYGTLTYTDSSRTNANSVRLTSSNIKSRSFTTKTSGSDQIGDVLYTGSGSRTETISYIGYIGATATFTGEVSFNAASAPTNVPVSFTCYSVSGIPLALSNFTMASPTAMANAAYITFGTPRTGKLINASGSSIGTTPVLVSQLGNVTYVPAVTSTVSSDSFIFSAYNVSGALVASGTVTVTISLPANAVKPGAITNINQLTDIPPAGPTSDWYRPQLTYLINKGVINGKGNGKFGPEDALTYGEALKMIMNAAGYYEAEADETQAGVSHWAQNYKNTAVLREWLPRTVDLNAIISRDNMAELTAKVLGIPAAVNQASPFADSSNNYAIALYNNKIVQGELWDNGTRHFTPTKALTRNEMVCLVYNMYQYTGK